MNVAVFWAIALMMETASISETWANFYQTARRNNPEDSHVRSEYFARITILYNV
jgi:hypothetical protein